MMNMQNKFKKKIHTFENLGEGVNRFKDGPKGDGSLRSDDKRGRLSSCSASKEPCSNCSKVSTTEIS